MKRTIAIVAGGDTSEFHVSLRSAQGIYSFIDKEKYTLYIVEMHGLDWHVQLPDGAKAPVDRNDFSFCLLYTSFRFFAHHVLVPLGFENEIDGGGGYAVDGFHLLAHIFHDDVGCRTVGGSQRLSLIHI